MGPEGRPLEPGGGRAAPGKEGIIAAEHDRARRCRSLVISDDRPVQAGRPFFRPTVRLRSIGGTEARRDVRRLTAPGCSGFRGTSAVRGNIRARFFRLLPAIAAATASESLGSPCSAYRSGGMNERQPTPRAVRSAGSLGGRTPAPFSFTAPILHSLRQ